jgi:hypothetical protein
MLIPKMDDVSEMALGEERKRIRSTGALQVTAQICSSEGKTEPYICSVASTSSET